MDSIKIRDVLSGLKNTLFLKKVMRVEDAALAKDAIDVIEHLQKSTSQEWVSVETPPPEDRKYLVLINNVLRQTADLENGTWSESYRSEPIENQRNQRKVTHYCELPPNHPLPEPPKEAKQ